MYLLIQDMVCQFIEFWYLVCVVGQNDFLVWQMFESGGIEMFVGFFEDFFDVGMDDFNEFCMVDLMVVMFLIVSFVIDFDYFVIIYSGGLNVIVECFDMFCCCSGYLKFY